jgi:hypothetical protein
MKTKENQIKWNDVENAIDEYYKCFKNAESMPELDWVLELLLSKSSRNEVISSFKSTMEYMYEMLFFCVINEEYCIASKIEDIIKIENKSIKKIIKKYFNNDKDMLESIKIINSNLTEKYL